MTPSVLGSVTLGYELIWNQNRRCCGVRLFVDADWHSAVDTSQLVAAITSFWPDAGPRLLLSVRDPSLLSSLLDHAPVGDVWVEVADHHLYDAPLANRVRKARARGLSMVWSGEAGVAPDASIADAFHKTLRALTPMEALGALRASLRKRQEGGGGAPPSSQSPIVAGSLYQGLASQALVEHALDRHGAWAVVGWPQEEILYAYRFRQIQPSRKVLRALIKSIEDDASLDVLEHHMGDDPLLVYRFLRYANSAHLGARCEMHSVREGLMIMGYSKLRMWLMEQIPHASEDRNLDPIRFAMVLRARAMEHLADAGIEDALRREVFQCGIFSQLDLLLGESLGAAIHHLPLPGRIASAVVGQTGPYAPWLEVASALESSNTRMIREVCNAHKMPADEVNRALLHTLATI